jgi:AraC family transcriptional regulator
VATLINASHSDDKKDITMGTELAVGLPTGSGIATYPAGASYGPRVLQDYEFVWMLEGHAEYQRDNQTIDAPAGCVLLCQPGATDAFQWDRHGRTRHGFFHFPVYSVPENWPPSDAWPVVRLLPPDDLVRPLFRHLLTWQDRENAAQCRLTIAHLLSVFVSGQTATSPDAPSEWPESVARAVVFLRRTLTDDPARALTLTQLADAACVTPEHLCRLFQASIGQSPLEAVRLARLEYAAGLLARSNYTISQISVLCGFANPFHFSRAFKRVYGLAPTQARHQSGIGFPQPQTFPSSKDSVTINTENFGIGTSS